MGSTASVHTSPTSTFLTATNFNEESCPEEEEEEGEEEDDEEESCPEEEAEEEEEDEEEDGDYVPPPSPFYTASDFETVKLRHHKLKEAVGSHIAGCMSGQISRSIEDARVISSKKLSLSDSRNLNERYIIDPDLLADMESRGSMYLVKKNRKLNLECINKEVASKNKVLALRNGVKGMLPCSTFQDCGRNQYHSAFQPLDTVESIGLHFKPQPIKYDDEEDQSESATLIEFRKHFNSTQKKPNHPERRDRPGFIDSVVQRLREWYLIQKYER